MRTTIDKAGRLVLPKRERDRLGLRPGDDLEIEPTADGLHLRSRKHLARLVKDGQVLVYAGGTPDQAAERALERHRDDRITDIVRQALS